MNYKLYISGTGVLHNVGSLKDKRAATALKKKIDSGKVDSKFYSEVDNADIWEREGGAFPGDSELVVKMSNGKKVGSVRISELPFFCFEHRFSKVDPKEQPFVWNYQMPIEGDFFFLEIETDDEFDEEELVKQISDSISLTVDHLFYGDKRIGMFVCNAEWNGDSMLSDCDAEDEDEDFSIATETGDGDLTVYAD